MSCTVYNETLVHHMFWGWMLQNSEKLQNYKISAKNVLHHTTRLTVNVFHELYAKKKNVCKKKLLNNRVKILRLARPP